jgi:hypothetical protein
MRGGAASAAFITVYSAGRRAGTQVAEQVHAEHARAEQVLVNVGTEVDGLATQLHAGDERGFGWPQRRQSTASGKLSPVAAARTSSSRGHLSEGLSGALRAGLAVP